MVRVTAQVLGNLTQINKGKESPGIDGFSLLLLTLFKVLKDSNVIESFSDTLKNKTRL